MTSLSRFIDWPLKHRSGSSLCVLTGRSPGLRSGGVRPGTELPALFHRHLRGNGPGGHRGQGGRYKLSSLESLVRDGSGQKVFHREDSELSPGVRKRVEEILPLSPGS
jgi:hypothetical protein